MIVYGDRIRRASARVRLDDLHRQAATIATWPAGLRRHAAVVRLLIDSGELAQGVLDAFFAERGCDDDGPTEALCHALTLEAALLVLASWCGEPCRPDAFRTVAEALALQPLPEHISVKQPEGYASYALYPELYAAAAERRENLVVIGLRSIGTSLAAMVAAASGTRRPVVTLRLVGHPFERRLRIGSKLEQQLLSDGSAEYAVVDEGPRLSGSSYGAVADWLEQHGVHRSRVTFFPSHAGSPGPHASEEQRTCWAAARRRHVSFEDGLIHGHELTLLSGRRPIEDLSGGRWRERQPRPSSAFPPANTLQERRKILIPGSSGPLLARFVGLGGIGEARFERARLLSNAGFTPPAMDLRHGFLIEPWLGEAMPLDLAQFNRRRLVDHVARYLGFMGERFSVDDGTSPSQLLTMAEQNTREGLGEEAARLVARWRRRLPELEQHWRPVQIDGRMHRWEWLLWRGELIKTDALDHHDSHDCIGATDLAWDVAGAVIELGLNAVERDWLMHRLSIAEDVLTFCVLAYLAFQLGSYTMAATSHAGINPEESGRLRVMRDRYARELVEQLKNWP